MHNLCLCGPLDTSRWCYSVRCTSVFLSFINCIIICDQSGDVSLICMSCTELSLRCISTSVLGTSNALRQNNWKLIILAFTRRNYCHSGFCVHYWKLCLGHTNIQSGLYRGIQIVMTLYPERGKTPTVPGFCSGWLSTCLLWPRAGSFLT